MDRGITQIAGLSEFRFATQISQASCYLVTEGTYLGGQNLVYGKSQAMLTSVAFFTSVNIVTKIENIYTFVIRVRKLNATNLTQ
jgi:hypothetical protein